MLDRFTPLTHLLRVLVEALLDSFKNMLVLPACNPAFLTGSAAIPDGTAPASIGPIAAQRQSFFFIGEVVDQAFAGRTKINIFARQIAKVLADEQAFAFVDELDHQNRIVFINPVLKHIWKQSALPAINAFNKTLHQILPQETEES